MSKSEPGLLALKTFLFHTRKALSSGGRLRDILPWFGVYMRQFRKPISLAEGRALPWLPYAVTRWLEQYLQPDMRVFEYGAGASTLFFAPRVKELISVEHDAGWIDQLKEQLPAQNSIKQETEYGSTSSLSYTFSNGQHRLFLIPPEQGQFADRAYQSFQKPEYAGHHFYNYARSIGQFPDAYFDLILIDGRARNACMMHAWPKLKAGAYLLLDDAHRQHYASPSFPDLTASFTIIGPAPGSAAFHQTNLYQKSQKLFKKERHP